MDDPSTRFCVLPADRSCEDNSCPVRNPVLPGSGVKVQSEADYIGSGSHPLTFNRFYRSRWALGAQFGAMGFAPSTAGGAGWMHNYERQVREVPFAPVRMMRVMRPDGVVNAYTWKPTAGSTTGAGQWLPEVGVWDSLTEQRDATNKTTGWTLKLQATDAVETYSATGRLLKITERNGWVTNLLYSTAATPISVAPGPDYLIQVTNHFGRMLKFSYDPKGRIIRLTDPGNGLVQYGYDGLGNLATVTWQDTKFRQYHYEDARYPAALTGITDELGVRIGTYTYDATGRVASTERAGGQDRLTLSYSSPGSFGYVRDSTNPNRSYTFSNTAGVLRTTGVSSPIPGEGPADKSAVYDASGNKTKAVAFDGTTTFSAYDSKGRATERATFPASFQTATTRPALSSATRVVSTQWHATWNLPLQQAEPNRITAYTYDSKGNLASQSSTATTDNIGAAQFTATKIGPTTATAWGYDAKSLNTSVVETAGGVETGRWLLTYNTLGDVTSIKDVPRNRTATMTQYDGHGHMLAGTTDLGTSLALTYSPRGDITREARNAQAVDFTYNALGNLLKVRTPDGQTIDYVLDANQRLIDMKLNGVSITPQMLAQADYPDTALKAQVATAKKWLALGLSALIRDAHAQAVVVIVEGPKRPQFDPRTDMLMSPMSPADKAFRALQEAIARACTCDPSNGYSKPKYSGNSFVHVFTGGHTTPMWSDQSYFTEKVGQALVDEVVAKAATQPGSLRQEGTRHVYRVNMGRDIGKFPTPQDTITPFQTTRWVRLVVEKNNCAGRWKFNEVVTIFPQEKPNP
ncbi:MAG: RHS repeat protein [Rhizobacter sp.]